MNNDDTLPQLRAAPAGKLVFLPLGGSGEIGMNLNVYGCDGRLLVVDMGVTFGDDFIPGVDVVMPDPIFLEENAEAIEAIVITHAHEDHLGAVPYLWPELRCPVYASPFAAAVLRGKLKEAGLLDEVELIEIDIDPIVVLGE